VLAEEFIFAFFRRFLARCLALLLSFLSLPCSRCPLSCCCCFSAPALLLLLLFGACSLVTVVLCAMASLRVLLLVLAVVGVSLATNIGRMLHEAAAPPRISARTSAAHAKKASCPCCAAPSTHNHTLCPAFLLARRSIEPQSQDWNLRW
jgi:hypothetical protein